MRPKTWVIVGLKRTLIGACLMAAACQGDTKGDPDPDASTTDPDAAAQEQVGADVETLRATLRDQGSVDVLVTLSVDDLTAPSPTALVEPIAEVLTIAFDDVLSALPQGEHERFRVYRNFPTLALRLFSERAFDALVAHPRTRAIHEDIAVPATLEQSLALINQPTALSNGHGGAGTTIAVLDTGLDYTRAAFGSCTSPGVPSGCKVAAAVDFAPNDGALDRGNYHGTNVAGIVLGVAPQARVAGLDVFNGDSGMSSDIAAAVDWVISNRATYNIVAMNLSLGGGSYTSRCGSSGLEPALSTAKSQGIVAAIATGNNGWTNAVSWPACSPSAVAVGAVYDSSMGARGWSNCNDPTTSNTRVTCFSNSASFIDLLAPGAMITAADITMGGTSQATPHVAGAIGVLRGAYPSETSDRTIERMKLGGVNVTDHRNNVIKPRLDLVGALAAGAAPTGTISIAGNAATTRTQSVTLALSASGGVNQMCLSNSSTCTSWIAYATSKTWTLSAGTGTKTVTARFRSAPGSESSVVSDTILLDVTPPTNGTLNATADDASVALSWSGFSDGHSGVASYKVVYAAGATAPGNCNSGITGYSGTDTSVTATGLVNGATYSFRVCAIDGAGNLSSGLTRTLRPAPEYDPPTGSVVIAGGATYAQTRAQTLTLSASDASNVTHMCISNATTCTAYVPFATSYTWTLPDGTGLKTVRVWFRDQYNNVMTTPVSDTITLDRTGPTNGTLTGSGSDGSLSLSWSGQTDAHSGVASHKLLYVTTPQPPSSCFNGTVAYAGTDNSFTLDNLTNGTTYRFRLCTLDAVGNWSVGATLALRPAPEYDGPTVSVSINSDASYTGSRSVTLGISGSDESTITHMCISNTTTCTAFEAFATSRTWTLPDLTGQKAVRVWLRDQYNNVSSTPALDTILLDRTAPTSGTFTATAGSQSVSFTWSAQTDGHSGFASYKLVYSQTTLAPPCASGTTAYAGTDRSHTQSGLLGNTTYAFRLCGIDNAGNVNAGLTRTVRTLP